MQSSEEKNTEKRKKKEKLNNENEEDNEKKYFNFVFAVKIIGTFHSRLLPGSMNNKLNVPYELQEQSWHDYYQFEGSRIWDCARYFKQGMYVTDSVQCISFGLSKPLQIGLGGCILTDDKDLYERASRMRYDGRDIFNYSPWATQQSFDVGYHYYLRPEECVVGLNLLKEQKFTVQLDKYFNYPDCRSITINDN